MKGNPVVTGAAGGIGVFLGSLFIGGSDLIGALVAGCVTALCAGGILWVMNRRRG